MKIKDIWNIIKKHKKIFISVLIFIFFSTWIIFIDEDNLINSIKRVERIKQLEAEIKILEQKIEDLKEQNNQNSKSISEKYARETLFMKNEDEDIFIIDTLESRK